MIVKKNISPLSLAVPALFDFVATILMFIALTMIPASVYQMMRGFTNVATPIISIYFLDLKQYRHHWLGIVSIVIGVAAVGAVAMDYDETNDLVGSTWLGILLVLIAQVFVAGLFVVEEYFLSGYKIEPLKICGLEGMWGLLFSMAALPFLQLIKCTDNQLCRFGYAENSAYIVHQMNDNPAIIWVTLSFAISVGIYNVVGITTTQISSSSQRASIDTARIIVVWAFSVWLGLEKFHWESTFGFAFLAFGTVVYNEMLVLPFCGLN